MQQELPATITEAREVDMGVLPALLGYQLRRAQLIVFQNFARHLADDNVTPTQFAVLELIAVNTGLSQRALASAVGTDQSTLVALLDRLQKRGWVARKRATHDRRYQVLSLTEAGIAALAHLRERVAAQDDLLAAPLSVEERATLMALLRRIRLPR